MQMGKRGKQIDWNRHMISEPPQHWYWGPPQPPGPCSTVWYIAPERQWPEFQVYRAAFICEHGKRPDCYFVRQRNGQILLINQARVFLSYQQAHREAAVVSQFGRRSREQ
jgi:hypothetical protein